MSNPAGCINLSRSPSSSPISACLDPPFPVTSAPSILPNRIEAQMHPSLISFYLCRSCFMQHPFERNKPLPTASLTVCQTSTSLVWSSRFNVDLCDPCSDSVRLNGSSVHGGHVSSLPSSERHSVPSFTIASSLYSIIPTSSLLNSPPSYTPRYSTPNLDSRYKQGHWDLRQI